MNTTFSDAPALIEARLESVAEAMEAEDFPFAMGLLVGLLGELDGAGLPSVEAKARAFLAQALASTGEMDAALDQAGRALAAAERTDHHDVIHRCMALLASLRFMAGAAADE